MDLRQLPSRPSPVETILRRRRCSGNRGGCSDLCSLHFSNFRFQFVNALLECVEALLSVIFVCPAICLGTMNSRQAKTTSLRFAMPPEFQKIEQWNRTPNSPREGAISETIADITEVRCQRAVATARLRFLFSAPTRMCLRWRAGHSSVRTALKGSDFGFQGADPFFQRI